MEGLIYFLFWAVLIALMLRFGCGAHIMGQRKNGRRDHSGGDQAAIRWVPPVTDTDPVCGETVLPENAKPSVHAGHVYYFCSHECREAFEAAPHLYLGDPASGQTPTETRHG